MGVKLRTLSSLCLFAVVTGSAHAQALSGGDSGPDISIWRVAAALVFCLALAAGAIFAWRRRLRSTGGLALFSAGARRMQLIETIRPSPALAICLIRCDGKDYLIAIGPQGATLIDCPQALDSASSPP